MAIMMTAQHRRLMERLEQAAEDEETQVARSESADDLAVATEEPEPAAATAEQTAADAAETAEPEATEPEHIQTPGEQHGNDASDVPVQRTQEVPSLFNQTPDVVRPDAPDAAANKEDR